MYLRLCSRCKSSSLRLVLDRKKKKKKKKGDKKIVNRIVCR
jgi:hypothetical protein